QAVAIEGSQRRANPALDRADSDGDNPFLDLPGQPRRVAVRSEDPLRSGNESAESMP
ncbi:hypothetical protein PF70_06809, partial [Pseudomonas asplenii]